MPDRQRRLRITSRLLDRLGPLPGEFGLQLVSVARRSQGSQRFSIGPARWNDQQLVDMRKRAGTLQADRVWPGFQRKEPGDLPCLRVGVPASGDATGNVAADQFPVD